MREQIQIIVYGTAKPAGSKTAFCLKKGGAYTGRAIVTDACKGTKGWQSEVKDAARKYAGDIWTCPISLSVRFFMRRPNSHYRTGKGIEPRTQLRDDAPAYHTSKPDALKLARAIEDALTGCIWADDALICQEHITKLYGMQERVEILIREVSNE